MTAATHRSTILCTAASNRFLSVHGLLAGDGQFFISPCSSLAVIGPLYVIALKTHLLDSIWLLIILYTAMNLPLVSDPPSSSGTLRLPRPSETDGVARSGRSTEVILPAISPRM